MFGRSSKVELTVEGMSCGHCEETVVDAFSGLDSVKKVKADHNKRKVTLYYRGEQPTMVPLRAKITDLGYELVEG